MGTPTHPHTLYTYTHTYTHILSCLLHLLAFGINTHTRAHGYGTALTQRKSATRWTVYRGGDVNFGVPVVFVFFFFWDIYVALMRACAPYRLKYLINIILFNF